jgi:hypothetical protein
MRVVIDLTADNEDHGRSCECTSGPLCRLHRRLSEMKR